MRQFAVSTLGCNWGKNQKYKNCPFFKIPLEKKKKTLTLLLCHLNIKHVSLLAEKPAIPVISYPGGYVRISLEKCE